MSLVATVTFAEWIQGQRKFCRLSKVALAKSVKIDPSYVTLIETKGFVPSERITARLGRALGDEDKAMIVAGYIPYYLQPMVLNTLERARKK
jgi:ribosome-binding protein aMBF1 (putative translation factor)